MGGGLLPPPSEDAVEAAAERSFTAAYGSPKLAALTVVVPAHREAGSIAEVLERIPSKIHDLEVDVLVVVDGDVDDTARIAREHDAFVCVTAERRGQGAALRLGYRLAIAHGADYIVTIDADGQYDPGEIPRVVEPLVRGEADFVSGSRRLGVNETGDAVRALGVVVFAGAIRLLTHAPVTDPAFGLRAMTRAVAERVVLRQPQYQAAELLISTISAGFRVAERPATMHERRSGKSRKGPNVLYGLRFARVVISTWWRERRPA